MASPRKPKDLKRVVALVIRRRREELKLTQEMLAGRLDNKSATWIANLEKGENVTLETIVKLAHALELPSEEFLQRVVDALVNDRSK